MVVGEVRFEYAYKRRALLLLVILLRCTSPDW